MPVLDDKDFEILDARYRKVEDCEDIKDDYSDKLNSLGLDIAVIKTKLTGILWGVGIMCGAAITAWAKYMFGG